MTMLALSLYAVQALDSSSSSNYVPFGYQSGTSTTDHNSYAGSIAIHNHVVVVTGTTYSTVFGLKQNEEAPTATATATASSQDSDCFVAMFELQNNKQSDQEDNQGGGIVMEFQDRFGVSSSSNDNEKGAVSDTCSKIITSQKGSKLYTIGHAPPGGLLTQEDALHHHPSNLGHQTMYGTLLEFGVTTDIALQGGHIFDTSSVQYPIDIVQGGGGNQNKNEMFVSVMSTDDTSTYPLSTISAANSKEGIVSPYSNLGTTLEPNYIEYYPFGRKKYAYEIHKLTEKPAGADDAASAPDNAGTRDAFTKSWVQTFRAVPMDTSHLQITSMIQLSPESMGSEQLVVSGYTNGHGVAVGGLVPSLTKNMNGFVTFINPQNGMVEKSIRIQSSHDLEDYVTGLCHDDHHVYVVGYTQGTLLTNKAPLQRDVAAKDTTVTTGTTAVAAAAEARTTTGGSGSGTRRRTNDDNNKSEADGHFEAFIQCIDLQTMKPTWTKQIKSSRQGKGNIYGMTCTVGQAEMNGNGNNGVVYLAGNVEKNTVVEGIPKQDLFQTSDNTDVFVAQFDAHTGIRNFVRQIGSTLHNDRIAPKGGLVIDPTTQNVIVYGTTQGSFQRQKMTTSENDVSDIFLLSLSKQDGSYKTSIDMDPENAMSDAGDATTTTTTTTTTAPQKPVTPTEPKSSRAFFTKILGKNSLPLLIGIGVVTLFAIGCIAYREIVSLQFELNYYDNDEVDPISQYLAAFEFGDIEIKHSASGGYHAIYTDPELAEQSVGETSSVAYRAEPYLYTSDHDRRVEDALFIDDYEPRNRFSMSGHVLHNIDDDSQTGGAGNSEHENSIDPSDIMASYDDRMDLFVEPQILRRPHRSGTRRKGYNSKWVEAYERESASFRDLDPFPDQKPSYSRETKSEGGSITSLTGLSDERNDDVGGSSNNNTSSSSSNNNNNNTNDNNDSSGDDMGDSKQTESTEEDQWGQDIC